MPIGQMPQRPEEGGFKEHAKRDSEIRRGVKLEQAQEGHEVGWRPKIDEIPGFIENAIVRKDISGGLKDKLVSLNKKLDQLREIHSGSERRTLEQKIIDETMEISSELPKVRIHLPKE